MSERNTLLRALHDVGLGAWFGGSLMGAVALNAAAGTVDDPAQRGRVANAGWNRWTPVNAAAIGAHLVGAAGILGANADRVASQKGVGASTVLKTAVTGAALVVTAWARIEGRKVAKAGDVPVASGAEATVTTPKPVAEAQSKLRALQWAVPATTGALLALTSYHGEQQRADQVAKGKLQRVSRYLVH